jgi:hypothetical protein
VPTRYDAASQSSVAWIFLALRITYGSTAVSTENDHCAAGLTGPRSRRVALHAGGALLAGLGACLLPSSVVAQATPSTGVTGKGLLLMQGFSHGNLFPTQGDVGVAPYTVILWDAADRGFFFTDWANATAGVVPTARVLDSIDGEAVSLRAVLVAASGEESGATLAGQQVWALSRVTGSLGSDPGAVTYQGEPLTGEEARSLLGSIPEKLPDSPRALGAGFLILAGLSGFDPGDADGVRLVMT